MIAAEQKKIELADELMAMAATIAAATSENGASVIREAAYQLRIDAKLLSALKEAHQLAEAHGWAPAHRIGWATAIAKAEGRS